MPHFRRRDLAALFLLAPVAGSRAVHAEERPQGMAGDRVICTNHHLIARLNRNIYAHDPLPLSTFSEWHIDMPTSLNPAPPCPRCGKLWYQSDTRNGQHAVNIADKGWLPFDPSHLGG